MKLGRWTQLLLVCLLMLGLSGCAYRTHRVQQRVVAADLQTATLEQLVQRVNDEAARVRTMNATVDIATSVGGERRGRVTEYQEVRGYVLVRKPDMLRMIGLVPVVRNRLFDMVSDGQRFRLSIPPRNRFVVGHNDRINPDAKQPLENLRPQHIFDALLLREINMENQIAVLEAGTEVVRDPKTRRQVEQPSYELLVIHRDEGGPWHLDRRIVFSRLDLQPVKQIVYDHHGNIATEARYENFAIIDGVNFPQIIQIYRPQEEYSIQLGIVKLRLNEELQDEQFALQQPAGAEVVDLDKRTANGLGSNPAQ